MKRYFVVNEFFGKRVYDSILKKEYYYTDDEFKIFEPSIHGDYNYIDNKKDRSISAPLKISMNITKRCNLRCVQCFSDSGIKNQNELTTNELKKLFDDMNKNGTFYICIGGGEPFTRDDLFEILEYGKKKQLAISIVTNGLLLNEEKINRLNDLDLDYLWISFEGLEKTMKC